MMDYGLLGEHGGSFSCRCTHGYGLAWRGMVWKGLGMIRNERSSKIGFLHSNVPLNVRTLELEDGCMDEDERSSERWHVRENDLK